MITTRFSPRPYWQGFVVGQPVPVGASPQQTETHWLPVTTTIAVLVSATPVPLSAPGAAPPSFWVTPNQGSAPIANAMLAGSATMVAAVPGATEAVTDEPVEAAPPLIDTEHQPK